MIQVPYIPYDELLRRAKSFTDEYCSVIGLGRLLRYGIAFDDIYHEYIYPKYEIALRTDIDLGVDEFGAPIMGEYRPAENVALVSSRLRCDPRYTFTLWHEVAGHGVLQGDMLRRAHSKHIRTTSISLDPRTERRLERQANIFAAMVAVPPFFLQHALFEAFKPTKPFVYRGPCDYDLMAYGQHSRVRIDSVQALRIELARPIQHRFGGLSMESISYRIADLKGLISIDVAYSSAPRICRRSPNRLGGVRRVEWDMKQGAQSIGARLAAAGYHE